MRILNFIKNHGYLSLVVGILIIGSCVVMAVSGNPEHIKNSAKKESATGSVTSVIGSSTSNTAPEATNTPAPTPTPSSSQTNISSTLPTGPMNAQNTLPETLQEPTSTAPDCSTYDSQIGSLYQQRAQIEDDLDNVDQTAEDEGNGYGVTSSGVQNLINQLTAQYDSELNSVNQQLNNLNSKYPDCS